MTSPQAGLLVALEHAAELVSREDAQLILAWPSGHLDDKAWVQYAELVNTRRWLVQDQVVPQLTGQAKAETERILASPEWQTLQSIEDQVLAARNSSADADRIALPDAQKRWNAAMDKLSAHYARLIEQQTTGLLERSADKADGTLIKAASLSAAWAARAAAVRRHVLADHPLAVPAAARSAPGHAQPREGAAAGRGGPAGAGRDGRPGVGDDPA